MIKVDTLEQAQKEGRAPWSDVVYDFKDMVWYNDGFPVTEGHSLIVPKEATQERIIKCMERTGGIISYDDLKEYKSIERSTINHEIYSVQPAHEDYKKLMKDKK